MDRTLSGTTTSNQSGLWIDGNKGVLCIARVSPSGCLASYSEHSLGELYTNTDMQSVYFAAPVDWASHF